MSMYGQEREARKGSYPLQELAGKFWPSYGGFPEDFPLDQFPIVATYDELMALGRDNLVFTSLDIRQIMTQWAIDAISFAREHAPEPACQMRQVFAATSYEVVNRANRVQGTLTVGGVNGMPPDHLEGTQFNPEETSSTIGRMLNYLFSSGQLDGEALQRLAEELNQQTQGKRLNCVEISTIISQVLGKEIRACRRRFGASLPKEFCPSILCAEGDALANRGIGETVWQLVAEEGMENVTIMPIAKFSSLQKDQRSPLFPAEYKVYYIAEGKNGRKEGMVALDSYAVFDLTKADSDLPARHRVALQKVPSSLQPTKEQTNIIIQRKGAPQKGYFYYDISYVNPKDTTDKSSIIHVDPWDFHSSWRYPLPEGQNLGEHKLAFNIKAIATSDVPCPRCSKLITINSIPTVVISGDMSLSPTYYEATCLYYLLKKKTVIINKELLETVSVN